MLHRPLLSCVQCPRFAFGTDSSIVVAWQVHKHGLEREVLMNKKLQRLALKNVAHPRVMTKEEVAKEIEVRSCWGYCRPLCIAVSHAFGFLRLDRKARQRIEAREARRASLSFGAAMTFIHRGAL